MTHIGNSTVNVNAAKDVLKLMATRLSGVAPDFSIKNRPDGPFLLIELADPHDRFYQALTSSLKELPEDHLFKTRCSIVKRSQKPKAILETGETRILQRELAESLTVDRHTFGDDFFSRYTASVTDLEQQVLARANFVLYGRRGSGKSSLLAYAMHSIEKAGEPYAWVALQPYSGRKDYSVVSSIVSEVLRGISDRLENEELRGLSGHLEGGVDDEDTTVRRRLERLLPRIRLVLGKIARRDRPATFFLDDLHVVDSSLQPEVLKSLYGLCRGNNCFLKISGIEQLTRLWDSKQKAGLEAPHDAQILKLDQNLTMPDRSEKHIISILDAHARFCGLPSITYLTTGDVLARLVLVAAAVPRDALSLFSHAITKSSSKGERLVSITSVNAAASEAIEEKFKDINKDYSDSTVDVTAMLERVKEFCVIKQRKNAFLVRINTSSKGYDLIQKLIALRFVHILHEGITPGRAGERYIALMLDFGFYIGIRAARSVQLFPDRPRSLAARELRKLPIFLPDAIPGSQ